MSLKKYFIAVGFAFLFAAIVLAGTKKVVWHKSYINNSTSYSIEDVKKDEDE